MFDRKSGTGRSPVENKKGGGGKANWGKPGQSDLEGLQEGAEQVEGKEPTQQDAKAEGGAPSDAPAEPVKEGEEAEEEEEDKTLTLEEFQAQQKKKLAKVKLPKTRKAGEGVEQDKQWAEAVPLTKKLDDEPETLVPLAPKKATKPKKKAKAKDTVSDASNLLSFTPAEPKRGGGRGRGEGRGRGRGGRGGRRGDSRGDSRGESRGGRGGRGGSTSGRGGAPRKYSPEQSAPRFDESSFPTLGKAE
jgi:plasminogen activator inhibitor 1 RNA-binding protein